MRRREYGWIFDLSTFDPWGQSALNLIARVIEGATVSAPNTHCIVILMSTLILDFKLLRLTALESGIRDFEIYRVLLIHGSASVEIVFRLTRDLGSDTYHSDIILEE